MSSFYDFGANRIEITTSDSSSLSLCLGLFVAVETRVNFVATLWFLQAYAVLRMHVLMSRCIAMESQRFFSDCTLPAFKRHVTLYF
jgi:hypothetical protein